MWTRNQSHPTIPNSQISCYLFRCFQKWIIIQESSDLSMLPCIILYCEYKFGSVVTSQIHYSTETSHGGRIYWADTSFAPCQWETALLCNDFSHWLGANLESISICSFKKVNDEKKSWYDNDLSPNLLSAWWWHKRKMLFSLLALC